MRMTIQTVREERPESPLARGKWAAPAWVIGVVAGLTLVATVAFLVVRIRRRLRERRSDDAPVSSRRRGRP